ncbi:MAG: isopentenyl-diphosphate Delta-isomerase [Candidatus Peregrinibacteria bacterium]
MRHVILCDQNGNSTSQSDLHTAHAGEGKLHRAFSVFVFRNSQRELLMQRRSLDKPLFCGLWANTCCSHPQEGEDDREAAEKRLREECGFSCPLSAIASFVYRAPDPSENGTEYEYDTIFVGDLTKPVTLNADPKEVMELKWQSLENIIRDMTHHAKLYAPWFPLALHAIFSKTS